MNETREFNQIVAPYLRYKDQELMTDAIQRALPAHCALYGILHSAFPQGGQFQQYTRSGDFGDLQSLAVKNADMIGRRYPAELTIPATFAVHGIASTLVSILRPLDVAHSEDRSTYFLTQFASSLALQPTKEQLLAGPDPFDFLHAISRRSRLLSTAFENPPEWMSAKFLVLSDRLLLRKHMLNTISHEPRLEVDDLEGLKETNDALFMELRRLKRYSIKSAIHETSTAAWSIHDTVNLRSRQMELVVSTESAIRPFEWRPFMVMSAIESPVDRDGIVESYINTDADMRSNYEQFGRQVFMDENGELFADPYGSMPLVQFYEQNGMPGNYEALRQYLIEAYFDLTIPTEMVVEAKQATRRHMVAEHESADGQPDIVYHDLLLPRIRLLRNVSHAEQLDELDQQLENHEMSLVSPQARRRLHEVGAFPRTLPQGYKASEQAAALAKELGIRLEANETLVRMHRRGDPRKGSVIYRAKQRSDGSARE